MALSQARDLFPSKGGAKTRSLLMAASTQIYRGGYVMLNSAGLAVPAAAAAGNHGGQGVALEDVLSDASTPTYVRVQYGEMLLTGQNFAQARVGEVVYCDDDETVNSGAAAAANTPPMGHMTEYVAATSSWVDVQPALNSVVGPHA